MRKQTIDGNSKVAVLSSLHDADLTGIRFGNREVVLEFRTPSGDRLAIALEGVVHFLGSGFAEGNVVLDAAVVDDIDSQERIVERLLPGSTSSQKSYREEITLQLRQGKLSLFQLSPSYGGEILAIFERLVDQPEERSGSERR